MAKDKLENKQKSSSWGFLVYLLEYKLLLYWGIIKKGDFIMIEAYKKFWKGYVDFKGRSTRSDYWLAVLANTIVTIILFSIVIVVIVFDSPDSHYHVILNLLYLLVMTYFFASFIPLLPFRSVAYVMPVSFGIDFLRFASFIWWYRTFGLCCQPTKVEVPFNNVDNPKQ